MFVDAGGVGGGVVDILNDRGFKRVVRAVMFGSKALADDRYHNRRAEMWDAANYGSIIIGVPDDGTIQFSKNMSADISLSGFRHLVNCPYTYEPSRRVNS